MDQRLSMITLGVRDMARAKQFYEAMGWRANEAGGAQIVFFQLLWTLPPPGAGRGRTARRRDAASKIRRHCARLQRARQGGSRSCAQGGRRCRRNTVEAGAGGLLGRLFRLLRRSRRTSVGGRLQPALAARTRRFSSNSRTINSAAFGAFASKDWGCEAGTMSV